MLARRHVHPRNYVSVSDTVTVIIGHDLGKVEAVRRLKEGFAHTNGHLGSMIAMEEASISFQLLTEMRNKIVESLQELMRMQI